jgi:hypothetical protein
MTDIMREIIRMIMILTPPPTLPAIPTTTITTIRIEETVIGINFYFQSCSNNNAKQI